MNGFLCINKPEGLTSRDVVNAIQRHVRPVKVGHAGTLDPLATGVLVVAVGRATKLVPYVQQMPKRYQGRFELGKSSDTEDITGTVDQRTIEQPPSTRQLEAACAQFSGQIEQRPPAYSALRIKGKRAYELARKGQQVDLAARTIQIYSIKLTEYCFPEFEIDVRCGSGTYIRSLGRDIGDNLKCGAVMTRLKRTEIGKFKLSSSIELDDLLAVEPIRDRLQPMAVGVDKLPQIELSDESLQAISFGQKLNVEVNADEVAAFTKDGELAAILSRTTEGPHRPRINFCARS